MTSVRTALDRAGEDIHNRIGPWLQTREGIAASCVAVVVFAALWGPVSGPLLPDALGAACATILVCLTARVWESRTAPPAPPFSLAPGAVDGRVELRHDPNAGFWRDNRGFLRTGRVWFAGTGCRPCQLRPDVYLRLRAWREQGDLPVFVARAGERQWWWWRDSFYFESGDFDPEDLRVLLAMHERDDGQSVEWALGLQLAQPIPAAVKRLVFERDGGRCLACGSEDLIQYAHVVPSSMGGSNEPQNIRLLCGACNRL